MFTRNGKWYFYDETWVNEHGPYDTEYDCIEAIKLYGLELDDPDQQGFYKSQTYTREDNVFWDGTEGAHPAWWRGQDQAIRRVENDFGKALGLPLESRRWQIILEKIKELKNA